MAPVRFALRLLLCLGLVLNGSGLGMALAGDGGHARQGVMADNARHAHGDAAVHDGHAAPTPAPDTHDGHDAPDAHDCPRHAAMHGDADGAAGCCPADGACDCACQQHATSSPAFAFGAVFDNARDLPIVVAGHMAPPLPNLIRPPIAA